VLNLRRRAYKPRSIKKKTNYTPRHESASELYRPSDRRLSEKLEPIFGDRRCHVVRVSDLYRHILGLLDLSRYFFFPVAPQLYSRGRVDPVPVLLRKSGSGGNRTWTSGSVAGNSDHKTTKAVNFGAQKG
jgi:hypothetical protein